MASRIRDATREDLGSIIELWREFRAEAPEPAWRDDAVEDHLRALEVAITADIVLLAEEAERPVGLALTELKNDTVGFLHILYVRPDARRSGLAAALVRETVNRLRTEGRGVLELEVLASNTAARAVYSRWGLSPVELTLATPLDTLAERLA